MGQTSSITQGVAAFINRTGIDDVPGNVLEIITTDLLDLVGCVLHGHSLPWGRAITTFVREHGKEGAATVWGTDFRRTAADAVLAIGTLGHAFDFDDYHSQAKLHAAVAVVPPIIATAEELDLSGREVMEALAVGMECMIRLSLAMGPVSAMKKGFHVTGICGPFGVAAGLAKLLALPESTTAGALGIAATSASGLFGFITEGSDTKRLHPGFAAQRGIQSIALARAGLTGPARALEVVHGGFFTAFSDESEPERLLDGIGREWATAGISLKRYPTCGGIQTTTDLVRQAVRDHGAENISSIQVGHNPATIHQNGQDYHPNDQLTAQMNLKYCVSAVLVEGDLLPAQFREEMLASPQVLARVNDVSVIEDAEVASLYPRHPAARVRVTTRSGGVKEYFALGPKGSPDDPLSRAEVEQKFRGILPPEFDPDRAGNIIAAAVAVLNLATIRDFTSHLAVTSASR